MMGTGNFNITLAQEQNPDMDFGVALLPGVETGQVASFIGGDIVTVPKGSKRVDDAVDFMKFLLSDEVQVEVYAKMLNMTTRGDMADNKYFQENPKVQDVAKAIAVGRDPLHAQVLRADQLAAGAVAADAAARLLRGHRPRHHHLRSPGADEGDRRRVTPARRRPAPAPRICREGNGNARQAAGGSPAFSTSLRRSPSCWPSPPGPSRR